MKNSICFVLCALVLSGSVQAQSLKEMSDAEQLGMMAGLALACGGGKKLDDYELISARILANEAPTDTEENRQARIYAQAKWDAMQRAKKDTKTDCREVMAHFNKLPIFNSIVYGDGSVKLPDGVWSKPIRPVKR